MNPKILILSFIFLSSLPLHAQSNAGDAVENVYINDILNDNDTIWLATRSGLVKHEKLTGETTFYTKEQDGVTDAHYVGYPGYDQTSDVQLPGLLPSNFIHALNKDVEGNLWLTAGGGLVKFNGTKSILYAVVPMDENYTYFPVGNGSFILIDEQSNKWIGCNSFLMKFNGTVFQRWGLPAMIKANIARSGYLDKQGTVWIGSYAALGAPSLSSCDGSTITSYDWLNEEANDLPFGGHDVTVNAIEVDAQDHVWLATSSRSLARLNEDSTFTYYHVGNSNIPAYTVMDIKSDNAGNLWMLCNDGGGKDQSSDYVVKYDGTDFTSWEFPFPIREKGERADFYANYTPCMAMDSQGDLWIGTKKDGLIKFSNGIFSKIAINLPDPTGIESTQVDSKPQLLINGNNVNIAGAEKIEAFNLSGQCITSVEKDEIYLPSGFYFLRASIQNESITYKAIIE